MVVGENEAVSAEQSEPDHRGAADPAGSGWTAADARRPRRLLLLFSVAAVLVALDVVTKVAAVGELEGRPPVAVLGGLVYFDLVRNPGAAFSLATGMTWLLALLAIVVACVIGWLAPKLRSGGWAVGLGAVLAGTLGNLADRIFREPGPLEGRVVDFVSLFAPGGHVWPVFNVADSSIVCGAALVVLMSLLGRDYDGTVHRSRRAAETSGEGS